MELNYKSFGQGEDVVILHGLFGMLDNWKSFATKLAADYKVWILDQRNHGRSPHSKEFNYHILSDDLRMFFDQHGIHNAKLIGHSMGAKVAMLFTSEFPELVNQLIVIDMGIKAYKGNHESILDAVLNIPVYSTTSRRDIEDHLKISIFDHEIRQFILKNLGRKVNHTFYWKANFKILKDKYLELISELILESPLYTETLFVRGGRSSYILLEDWEHIKEYFPNGFLISFEDAGHWVHVEKQEELLGLTRVFFANRLIESTEYDIL